MRAWFHRHWLALAGALTATLVVGFLFLTGDLMLWLRGVRTTGHVTETHLLNARSADANDFVDGNTRPHFRLRVHYRFRDRDDRERFGVKEVETTGLDHPYYPGRPVPVTYLPDEPERNRLGSTASPRALVIGLLVALVVGGGLVGVAMVASRSDRLLALIARFGGRSLHERLARRRRQRLLGTAFPFAWERILRKNLGLFADLTVVEQERLKHFVQVLVAEKEWTGCNGLEMTDEVRVTIAGAAGVLLLACEHTYYETVRSILVYPTTFAMPAEQPNESGVAGTREGVLGLAWYRGPVILAWDEVLADCRQPYEGRNLVYHEFAHQLAFEGASLAATGKEGRERWERFGAVMRTEYEALVQASAEGRATLIDRYGATNPDEFFAVATECFFGQPEAMELAHPQLYTVLRELYQQDTAERFRRSRSANGS
jgi:Mlc titration factor MtfA (ptsG expression regulator)